MIDPTTKASEKCIRSVPRNTILQLSTPFTDHIASNSPPLEPWWIC